jgi:poly(glycerol-phosphate) alpha-glucosyltransferase
VDTDSSSIVSGIQELISLSEDKRTQMGLNGYQLVEQKFTWNKVAEKTLEVYKWISGKGPQPEFIIDN